MGSRIASRLLLAGLAAAARPAWAQEVEVGLAGGRVTDERGATHAALTLSPSVRWTGPASVLQVGAQGTVFPGGVLGAFGLEGGITDARLGPVEIALAGEGAASISGAGYGALRGALRPGVRLASDEWGIEAGLRVAGGGVRGGVLPDGPLGLLPGERNAVRWRGERGLAAAAWGRRGAVSARAGWRGREIAGTRWQEWSGAARIGLDRAAIEVSAGRRTGTLHETWVAASASARVREALSLTAGAGSYPPDPLTGQAGGRFASAGVALHLGESGATRRAPLAAPAPFAAGPVHLALRARPGARVELLADWTDWRPRPVPETSAGEYAVDVVLPPGSHRFLFRVDGEWRTPEGFATEPDGFGGEHAVIRVR